MFGHNWHSGINSSCSVTLTNNPVIDIEFLSQTHTALRGPQGTVQTPSDAIRGLSGRLSQSAWQLPDRRAAVLSLKGLARDCRKEIGESCRPGLIEILLNDTDVDADIAKACLGV